MDELREFSEKDLIRIIDSSKEDSVVKKRYRFLERLNDAVRNAINPAKGFFQILTREGVVFPPDIVYERTEEQVVDGQKISITRQVDCLGDALALFDNFFTRGLTCTKLVVGVDLENIFRQLKGEDADIPENLNPEVIIQLGISQTLQAFEGCRQSFDRFFSEREASSESETKARPIISRGIARTIGALKYFQNNFSAPQEPGEPEV